MAAIEGCIEKMKTKLDDTVQYSLPVGDELFPMNPHIGQVVRLEYLGKIHCVHCGRKTNKSFSQGHCFPCMRSLASCDMCVMKPETCHYEQGTCREPEWGEKYCMIPHTVYLANSSGIKVGITRQPQQQTRWMDQGATQALPILTVEQRLHAGHAEVALKGFVSDRTDWRKMLKGEAPPLEMAQVRDELFEKAEHNFPGVKLPEAQVLQINYPVLEYPEKVRSHNLDKEPVLEGTLMGIKGQYLIFDTAVINMRKYTGYMLGVSAG